MSDAMFAAATAALQQAVALSREERDGALATAAQEVRARETAVRVQGELEAMVAQATAQREACAAEASAAADRGAASAAAAAAAAARSEACEASLVAVGAERDAWASRAAELEASLQYGVRASLRGEDAQSDDIARRLQNRRRRASGAAPGGDAAPSALVAEARGTAARLRWFEAATEDAAYAALAAAVAGDALVAGLGAVAAERAAAARGAVDDAARRAPRRRRSRRCGATASPRRAASSRPTPRGRGAVRARATSPRALAARAAAAEARVAEASDAALGAFTAASADDRRRVVEAWAEDRAATTTRFLERLEALDRELALERAAAEVAAFALSDALEDLAPVAAILEIEGEDRGSRSASLERADDCETLYHPFPTLLVERPREAPRPASPAGADPVGVEGPVDDGPGKVDPAPRLRLLAATLRRRSAALRGAIEDAVAACDAAAVAAYEAECEAERAAAELAAEAEEEEDDDDGASSSRSSASPAAALEAAPGTPRARGKKRCSVDLLSPPKRWREARRPARAPLRGGDLAGVCDDVEARAEEDDGGDGAVKVWVRVRPVKAGDDAEDVLDADGSALVLRDPAIPGLVQRFDFDGVLDSRAGATQRRVFDDVGRDVVLSAFRGFNTTLFAYGQTGSGKTHTMVGDDDRPGLVPFVATALFALEARRAAATAATATDAPYLAARGERRVDAAYLEIYQDQLRDLLGDDDDAAALKLREHPKRGVYVEGLTRWALESPRELLDLLEVGAARRTVAATRMNRDSSRSHAALFLTFDDGRGASTQLTLVDLAGSERTRKSGASGKAAQMREACAINSSLSTLGRCVAALVAAGSTRRTAPRARRRPRRPSATAP
ncbi:hypothetical protein JL722_1573 [Aureococcus anophagefferens]|nr:hypothetical protein JL722_1573 [Aureococcus anophagefferens]